MLISSTRRIDGRPMQFEIDFTGVADPANDSEGVCDSVATLTKWYNERLAISIDLAVEQYWWLHRRWRTPPARVAKRMKRAA